MFYIVQFIKTYYLSISNRKLSTVEIYHLFISEGIGIVTPFWKSLQFTEYIVSVRGRKEGGEGGGGGQRLKAVNLIN